MTSDTTYPADLPVVKSLPHRFAALAVDIEAYDESDLIHRVLHGETDLFHKLVCRCERSMFFLAVSILGNTADAEDAVQEASMKALRSLASFRGEARFSTWLSQITLNEAKATLRKNRRYVFHSIDAGSDPENDNNMVVDVPDDRELPLETILRREMEDALDRALNALPPKFRAVVRLRDIEGLNTEQTAEMLGVTEANVKTRLSRARCCLRNTLNRGDRSSGECAMARG